MTTNTEIAHQLGEISTSINYINDSIGATNGKIEVLDKKVDELCVGNEFFKHHLNDHKRNKKVTIAVILSAISTVFAYLFSIGSNA